LNLVDAAWRAAYNVAYWTLRGWWFVRRPDSYGAFVFLWRGDEILLIRNSYRSGYTVPSGNLNRGETPRQAAQRELAEEVGLEVREGEFEYAGEAHLDFEHKRDHSSFFELQRDPGSPIELRIDRREVVWAEFCPVGRLSELDISPHVTAYLAGRKS
jgi:ADP-ribose pyrophosphatase YjhB (NUDIX family)